MTEIGDHLEILHSLKIKGRAGADEILAVTGGEEAALAARLADLAEQGLVVERTGGRRPGWMLTPAGREHHATALSSGLDEEARSGLAQAYEGFLALNAEVKEVSSAWQAASDDATRFELIERVHEVHPQAFAVLTESSRHVDRFARYGDRLTAALERVEEDPRYMVSPTVDSYHTVWFEAHEDYLLTLGRTREEEGSA